RLSRTLLILTSIFSFVPFSTMTSIITSFFSGLTEYACCSQAHITREMLKQHMKNTLNTIDPDIDILEKPICPQLIGSTNKLTGHLLNRSHLVTDSSKAWQR